MCVYIYIYIYIYIHIRKIAEAPGQDGCGGGRDYVLVSILISVFILAIFYPPLK